MSQAVQIQLEQKMVIKNITKIVTSERVGQQA